MLDIRKRFDSVATSILSLTRSKLLINFRFLDTAIGRLHIANDDLVFQLATNGQKIYFSTQWVVETYREEEGKLARAYLHTVLHCIFKHPLVSQNINKDYWNLATDIAVANILYEISVPQISCKGIQYQDQMLMKLRSVIKPITAEKVYRYFCEENYDAGQVKKLAEYFYYDNHGLWWKDTGGEEEAIPPMDLEALAKEWEEIAKKMDVDLDTLSKDSNKGESLSQNLKELNRDKYDYKRFLQKFSVTGEDMCINDEEFDYVYYTYGLRNYGNLPLIEPLEYKEIKKICDFVIAIDTSGSVKGNIVQKFLDKTYSILMMEESFFKKINILILQCDDQIQEEILITSKEEFTAYMKNMKVKGFGGTDFRPVFTRVEKLVEEKAFSDLRGIIYFTDGYGFYPKIKPNFRVAFIYLGYDTQRPPTPVWAIKLVMEEEQLAEELK